jgi:mannose-6-phosphate isomerase-like protein (cupin superfamily)
MSLIRKGEHVVTFTKEKPIEKHFHDHDEAWVILEGKAKAYMIDRDGNHREFELCEGDIWLIETGWEHGADPITSSFKLIYIHGTMPVGAQKPAHYYMENEAYIPHLELKKVMTDRYKKG